MVQHQLKLRLNSAQEAKLLGWLPILCGVWNFAIRKIELNARDRIYFSSHEFQNILAGHGQRLGIPSHLLQGVLSSAYNSWQHHLRGISCKPRLKGFRRPVNSVLFPDPISRPVNGKISVIGLGKLRFHKQWIPEGRIKCGRIIKRPSGWYLCLFIDAQPRPIPVIADQCIGIDPGFKSLLTFSTGEKIEHPREMEALAMRLGQAQRGHRYRLSRRIQERITSQRKNRNHKISRQLVAENAVIRFSKDHIRGMARNFGKSVASSGHYQLRKMLSYKCLAGGRTYDEPDSKFSTMTCSTCGALTGPHGWAGLQVRQWRCMECGTLHDRDVNAAINTLHAGAGCAHEGYTQDAQRQESQNARFWEHQRAAEESKMFARRPVAHEISEGSTQ